jgi:hypothetical protein
MNNKLNVLKVALTGGIYLAIIFALSTIAGILNIPGFVEFVNLLKTFYGSYGYSVTWLGVIIGAFWGFIEGFFHLGLFILIYNFINKNN